MEEQGPLLWAFIWVLNGMCVCMSDVFKRSSKWLSRDVPMIISTSCILLPFLLPEHEAAYRGVVALAACFYATKTREVITEDRFSSEPLWIRVVGVLASFNDVQERMPVARWGKERAKQIVKQMGILLVHVFCYVMVVEIFVNRHILSDLVMPEQVPLIWHDRVRTTIGCVAACFFVFFSLHVYADALCLVWLVIGFKFPPLMDAPERSLSVREFWKRWDTVVQKLLMKHVFSPCRAAGMPFTPAAALTFFASGLVHIVPIIMVKGNDGVAALSMMSYFGIQFSVMTLEQSLQLRNWNPWARRIWTLVHLFGPSYLLVFPCVRILGIDF